MLQSLVLGEEPAFPERAVRQITVLINAAVVWGDRDALCRIRNVSEGGLTIETSLPLIVDERVEIALRTGDSLSCTVRWCDNQRAGLSCDVDPTPAINRKAGDEEGPTLPRFERPMKIGLVVSGAPYHCMLDSISVRDVLATDVPVALKLGQMLSVEIPGLGVRPATVQISEEGDLFARFAPALSFATLDQWLVRAS